MDTMKANSRRFLSANGLAHELFAEQAALSPNSIAAKLENETITYGDLDHKSNQLARYLDEALHDDDKIVGIYLKRSIEMLIAVLGILKSGRAYLPIDTEGPINRAQEIIDDSGVKLLITHDEIRVPSITCNHILINRDWDRLIGGQPNTSANKKVGMEDAAYVLYTSGSTGKPKAVVYPHRGIYALFEWMQSEFNLTNEDVFLQKTSYTFDISTYEILLPLQVGAKIIIAKPGKEVDVFYLHNLIQRENISIINFAPEVLNIFLVDTLREKLHSLRIIISSGEALRQSIVVKTKKHLPNCDLYNLYGLTEVQSVTAYLCRDDDKERTASIGRSIAGAQLYVLDEDRNIVPPDTVGELYVGGVTVALGYLNQPQLTAEKFINNPSPNLEYSILYKTGDRVKHLSDGNFEYVGRLDSQVKIRGFRVELGEVEYQLERHDLVREAVVIASDKYAEEKCLVAYVVPSLENEETSKSVDSQLHAQLHEQLQRHLSTVLPSYMVPAFYKFLDEIPLNQNGKTDRKFLASI